MAELKDPRRILVVPLRFIGDTILTVPLLRNLRNRFPEAVIDVMTSNIGASLLAPCPYVDNVLVEPSGAAARWALIRRRDYDAGFILRKSVTVALICRLAGVAHITGYDKQRYFWPLNYKRWGLFLDEAARYPSLRTETPQALSHLNLLKVNGLEPEDDYLELWARPEDRTQAEALLEETGVSPDRPLAIVHLASASHGKTFDTQKFVSAVSYLHDHGYQLVATGLAEDYGRYQELATAADVPLVILAGKTSIRETFAIYRQADVILTVDSSPIHLAAAAGIPHIIGVFGPTNEKQWGPHSRESHFYPVFNDLPCRPCYAKVCEHNKCKVELESDQVLSAVRQAVGD